MTFQKIKLKYFLLPIIVVIFSFNAAFAQTFIGQHDISVSYGVYFGRQFVDALSMNNEGNGNKETSNSGNIFVSYKYFLESKFAIGITAGCQFINGKVYYYDGVLENSYKLVNKTIAGELTMVYFNKPYVQLYALLGFGASFASVISNKPVDNTYSTFGAPTMIFEPNTGSRFNWQIDPVSIRAGKRLMGYLELGFGYKGIVNGGISYTINRQRKLATLRQ